MKIQYLAVIFIIIMMPLIIVFSEYVNTQITLVNTEITYDSRLLNSTYDSIKAFQLNTINSTYYTPEMRKENISAAVNTFYNSLVTAFNYSGVKAKTMKEYVPAVVFTMYDGYYIYSPFRNILTNVSDEDVDDDYKQNELLDDLKPYIYYSCRYKSKPGAIQKYDIIITYTTDNFISIEGTVGDEYWSAKDKDENGYFIHSGYLMDSATIEEGLSKTRGVSETLKECIIDSTGNIKEYPYTIRNGTKYYYDDVDNNGNKSDNDRIYYIDGAGQVAPSGIGFIYKNDQQSFDDLYNEIFNNTTGHKYYEEAKVFNNLIKNKLSNLKTSDIVESSNYAGYKFEEIDNILDGKLQDSDSNFNRHRADVIRAVITTNLSSAISGFSKYSSSGEEFLMPKISDTDWELLENNICIVTFLQGMRIGGKSYNSYKVVPNNLNKEYIDEDDIYILTTDHTYRKVNDSTLNDSTIAKNLGYQPGVLKINFEIKKDIVSNKYYNPMSYWNGSKYVPFLASYTSIGGISELNSITTYDMYKYLRGETKDVNGNNVIVPDSVKKAYYTALGRERYGSYKFIK